MIRSRLRSFMIGRYGMDALSAALLATAVLLTLLAGFLKLSLLNYASYLPLVLCTVRILSKNIAKRRAENQVFLRIWRQIKGRFIFIKGSKTHKFFKCPSCKNILRVPRGKGRVFVTCPKCGERFQKKT